MSSAAAEDPDPPGSNPELEVAGYFNELRRPLYRYFLCVGLSRDDAEEGVQETFLRLHQHLARNGDRSNLRGWIFQVARNLAHNRYKSLRRQRAEALDCVERGEALADPRRGPEELAIAQERWRRLRLSVERLTPQQRECFLLRAAGLRYREIAAALGIGISAVGELVQRATARLSEDLL